MMSGNATIETAVSATKLGAFDFVEKPLSTDKLLITITNALSIAKLRRENRELSAQVGGHFAMVGKSVADDRDLRQDRQDRADQRTGVDHRRERDRQRVGRPRDSPALPAVRRPASSSSTARRFPSELIESELFGHEKGAFTGATQQRRGKFELADGGTLFLDEVGDMNPSAQAKVLRVLQEGELERVGGHETITCDVRVVAATNKDLEAEIEAGRFREDLFYRLNVVPIELPPLRERREDIPELVGHFLTSLCESNGRRVKTISKGAVTLLMQHDWPGNVRELKNSIERLVILTGDADEITEDDVADALPSVKKVSTSYKRGASLKDMVSAAERAIILEALAANENHISNTAKELQLERSHLYKKMKALGIDPRG